jgi:hypothetical protein
MPNAGQGTGNRLWTAAYVSLAQVYAWTGGTCDDALTPGKLAVYPGSPTTLQGPGAMLSAMAKRLDQDVTVLIDADVLPTWGMEEAPARDAAPGQAHPLLRDLHSHGWQVKGGRARAWMTCQFGHGDSPRIVRLGLVGWMDPDRLADVGVCPKDPIATMVTHGEVRARVGAPLHSSPGVTGSVSLRKDTSLMGSRYGKHYERVAWWPDNWHRCEPATRPRFDLPSWHREATPSEQAAAVWALDQRCASLRGAASVEVARDKLTYRLGPLDGYEGEPGWYLLNVNQLKACRHLWDGLPDPWAGCAPGHVEWQRWAPHPIVELIMVDLAGAGGIPEEALAGLIEEAWTSKRRERLQPWAKRISEARYSAPPLDEASGLDVSDIVQSVYQWTWTQLGTLKGDTQRPDWTDAVLAQLFKLMWLDALKLKQAGRAPLRFGRDTLWIPAPLDEAAQPLPKLNAHGGPLGGWKALGGSPVPHEVYSAARDGAWWREETRAALRQRRSESRHDRFKPGGRSGRSKLGRAADARPGELDLGE